MAKLSSLRTLLLDLRLILVLPFRDVDTVAWAHTLGPRFIAYADSGADPIAAVLAKMLAVGSAGQIYYIRLNMYDDPNSGL